MAGMPRELPLPEDCRVRLVDLPVSAGGMISVSEDGFVNIYLNARLSREAQERALLHELRHHYRGDLYSERDIRTVEREADEGPLAPFDPASLKPVAEGLYKPTGADLELAASHLDALRGPLREACLVYDVLQVPPLLDAGALLKAAEALGPEDIAFVHRQEAAVLHFSREDLYGAIYYDADGAPDNALAVLLIGEARVTVDVRRRNGKLTVCGISREVGERYDKVY